MMWKIDTFSDCIATMARCRNPMRGKPVAAGIRLYSVPHEKGTYYELRRDKLPFARIHSDNTLTLHGEPYASSNFLRRAFGVYLCRVSKKRVRCTSVIAMKQCPWSMAMSDWVRQQPEFYDGIRYDLKTMRIVNALPDTVRITNAQAEAQWRALLRKYKKGWMVRMKLGIQKAALVEVAAMKETPRLTAKQLHDIIASGDYGHGMHLILRAARPEWVWLAPGGHYSTYRLDMDVSYVFEKVYVQHREEIREMRGCFTDQRAAA